MDKPKKEDVAMEQSQVSYLEGFVQSLSLAQVSAIAVALILGGMLIGFIIGLVVFGK